MSDLSAMSVDAENAVLGSVMIDNSKLDEVAGILGPRDFTHPGNRLIFQAMLDLRSDAKPIDALLLARALAGDTYLDSIGGGVYISRLMDGIPHLINAIFYAQIVKDKATRVELRRFSADIDAAAQDASEDVASTVDKALNNLTMISAGTDPGGTINLGRDVDSFLDMTAAKERGETVEDKTPTGLDTVDRIIGGITPGLTYVFAARPRIGKSAMMLTIARNASVNDTASMIFSIEMPRKVVLARFVALEAQVDLYDLLRIGPDRPLTSDDWRRIEGAHQRLMTTNIVIDDGPVSTADIKSKVKREQLRRHREKLPPIKQFWVDYMGILQVNRARKRHEAISDAVLDLREFAKREGVAACLLAQLRRPEAEGYSKKTKLPRKPRLEDLKESGGLEEHPDCVILIDRDEVHLEDQGLPPGDSNGKAWVRVAKNRHGPTGTTTLKFWSSFTLFTEAPATNETFPF